MDTGVTTQLKSSEQRLSEDFRKGAENRPERLSANETAWPEDGSDEKFTASLGKLSAAVSRHKPNATVRRGVSYGRKTLRILERLERNSESGRVCETNRRVITIRSCNKSSVADLLADVLGCPAAQAIDLDFARLDGGGWDWLSLSVFLSELQRNAAPAVYVINWQHIFVGLERHFSRDVPFWYRNDDFWVHRMADLRSQFERLNRKSPRWRQPKWTEVLEQAFRKFGDSR